MHGLAVSLNERLPFALDLSEENSSVSVWLNFIQCLTSFYFFLTIFVFVHDF